MKIIDKGVLEPSYMDFTVPATFTRNALYYLYQFGHFYCNSHYNIKRTGIDMFLLMYICEGTMIIKTKGKTYEAHKDQIVLLDCHNEHNYYCDKQVEFIWYHFNGNNSAQYVQYINEQSGIVFTEPYVLQLKTHIETILSSSQAIMRNEHYISQKIGYVLSKLAAPSKQILLNSPFTPAVNYIISHYNKELDLQTLADVCNLSISHFIRGFKLYTGYTPHEYLLSYRLRQAKQLLSTSSLTIEEIAERCGFNSASHFARAFRSAENTSPTKFRKLEF